MAELKLTYGKASNGRLVHVDEVPRGLACECVCPRCDAQLVARKGEKKQHHFAHAGGADCAGARMTALHMLAQKIIQEEKKIRTPYYDEYIKNESKIIEFVSVELEPHYSIQGINRRPDCVGKVQKDNKIIGLWIEIKVTHKVDDKKQNDIKKLGVNCMEIDLSELLHTDYTKETISAALFTEIKNKKWINYPQLFKKNLEEKRKSKEFEEQQQLKLQQEREKIEILVNGWMNSGLIDNAEKIIEIIESNPYNQDQQANYLIIDFLVPEFNILEWLDKSPRQPYTKKIFYVILKYYIQQVCNRLNRKIVDERLNNFRFKQFVTEQEKIELELLISLKIVNTLRDQYYPYPFIYYYNEKKELYKKYISDEVFRNKCLKLLSIEYRHIIGSDSKDFMMLTEKIRRYYPNILPLFISILDYTHTTKRPKYGIPSLEAEQIVEAKKIVDAITVDEECYQLFDSVYSYLIRNHTFKRHKVVQAKQDNTEDMPPLFSW